jgi:hypothetical protein
MVPRASARVQLPERIAADRSGNHLVAVGLTDRLYARSKGDKNPKELDEDIVTAAWVPRR